MAVSLQRSTYELMCPQKYICWLNLSVLHPFFLSCLGEGVAIIIWQAIQWSEHSRVYTGKLTLLGLFHHVKAGTGATAYFPLNDYVAM